MAGWSAAAATIFLSSVLIDSCPSSGLPHQGQLISSSGDGGPPGACTAPISVAEFGGLPLPPQLLSIGSASKCTLLPSIFTVSEPGLANLAGPWVLAEIKPPPVPLLAMSPMLLKVAPLIATVLPSILTFLE